MLKSRASANQVKTIEYTVNLFINRIKKYDGKLDSVLEINPDAIQIAKSLDSKCAGIVAMHDCLRKYPLLGVAILLKDNIATTDKLNTTAGSLALLGAKAKYEATLVTKLRDAGAVILGKAGMSEWAMFRSSSIPSGVGGRMQVVNPYDTLQTPGGSSSGCGVAVAAGLTHVCIGTETLGSIMNPASNNNIFGIKPAPGQSFRDMVIPITSDEDTTGPLCRHPEDCRKVVNVIRKDTPKIINSCFKDPVTGKKRVCRVGYNGPSTYEDYPSPPLDDAIKQRLLKAGVELVELNMTDIYIFSDSTPSDVIDNHFMCRFKVELQNYLSKVTNTKIKTLQDVIDFNNKNADAELIPEYGQDILIAANNAKTVVSDPAFCLSQLNRYRATKPYIANLISKNKLDAIVMNDFEWVVWLAGLSGYPGIAIPRTDALFSSFGVLGKTDQLDYMMDIASIFKHSFIPPKGFL